MALLDMFRGSTASGAPKVPARMDRVSRRSTAFQEFAKYLRSAEGLTVLDLGPTSATNIMHLTSLGHKVYNEDVLMASIDPSLVRKNDDGTDSLDVERFFAENLVFNGTQFDAVMCWDIPDYLQESLV